MSVSGASPTVTPGSESLPLRPGLWLAWAAVDTRGLPRGPERRSAQSQSARQLVKGLSQRLGQPISHVGRSVSGAPLFGPGLCGSLAHCDQWVAALLGSTEQWRAVGVDIENDQPMPADARDYALDAVEQAALRALPGDPNRWVLAAFGLKECLHKCLSPLLGVDLDFDEVRIHLGPDGRLRNIEPLSQRARDALRGLDPFGEARFLPGAVLSWLAAAR